MSTKLLKRKHVPMSTDPEPMSTFTNTNINTSTTTTATTNIDQQQSDDDGSSQSSSQSSRHRRRRLRRRQAFKSKYRDDRITTFMRTMESHPIYGIVEDFLARFGGYMTTECDGRDFLRIEYILRGVEKICGIDVSLCMVYDEDAHSRTRRFDLVVRSKTICVKTPDNFWTYFSCNLVTFPATAPEPGGLGFRRQLFMALRDRLPPLLGKSAATGVWIFDPQDSLLYVSEPHLLRGGIVDWTGIWADGGELPDSGSGGGGGSGDGDEGIVYTFRPCLVCRRCTNQRLEGRCQKCHMCFQCLEQHVQVKKRTAGVRMIACPVCGPEHTPLFRKDLSTGTWAGYDDVRQCWIDNRPLVLKSQAQYHGSSSSSINMSTMYSDMDKELFAGGGADDDNNDNDDDNDNDDNDKDDNDGHDDEVVMVKHERRHLRRRMQNWNSSSSSSSSSTSHV